jgi:hypothetical protein
MRHLLSVRSLAFGLMFLGLAASCVGQNIEANSFRPATEEDRPFSTDRQEERERAYLLKNTGLILVVAGPLTWGVIGLLGTGGKERADQTSKSRFPK